jgi:hypothetical protein
VGLGLNIGGGSNTSPPASKPTSGGGGGGAGMGNKYTMYHGDGTSGAGWPSESQWVGDFETMWAANQENINCIGGVPQNSAEETANMKSAIMSVASESGLDARFIFAIILQESNGCVRVNPTSNGNPNPGLMQDAGGSHMCNDGKGNIQNPCPMEQITGMIKDGVFGTAYDVGNGFLPLVKGAGGPSDAKNYYVAAKLYNSGRASSILDLSISASATACYAADVANRLTGWTTAAKGCH